jgi:hypothetical protein
MFGDEDFEGDGDGGVGGLSGGEERELEEEEE